MEKSIEKYDVIILGAGAAGLMCAIEAGKRGRKVIILDHANKVGKKILMSGGGRCNFTNYNIIPDHYISHNKHFCRSALTRYTQWDFIELVKKYNIPFHEKTLGQLFCDHKSKDILDMLLTECEIAKVKILLNTTVENIEHHSINHFKVKTNENNFSAENLVVATGGLSIPTMGASPFGYQIAEQFNIKVMPTRAGLVPFTLLPKDKEKYACLTGIAMDSIAKNNKIAFRENILFTHRGLSGPAILQISSYWNPGEEILINLSPEIEIAEYLKNIQHHNPQKQLGSILKELFTKRFVDIFFTETQKKRELQSFSKREMDALAKEIHSWHVKPNGTEGYRTAEVTIGGVDCHALSSKTLESKDIKGLYFIGEVLDVTGWLGGYNFQWAWSSGWAAGQVV